MESQSFSLRTLLRNSAILLPSTIPLLVLNAERYSDCSDRTVPAKLQLFVFYAVFFQQLRVRLKLQVSISEPPELLLGAQSVT